LIDAQTSYGNGPDKPPTSILFGPISLSSSLYQLSPPEVTVILTIYVELDGGDKFLLSLPAGSIIASQKGVIAFHRLSEFLKNTISGHALVQTFCPKSWPSPH
jgi:hypothetical protein